MRHLILALSALLLAAPAARAAEVTPADRVVPEVVPTVTAKQEPAVQGALQLTEVKLEERAAAEAAAPAQLGERGSFWWVVGVIVVAGVILAVVL